MSDLVLMKRGNYRVITQGPMHNSSGTCGYRAFIYFDYLSSKVNKECLQFFTARDSFRGTIDFFPSLSSSRSKKRASKGEGGMIGRKRTRDFGAILLFRCRSVDRCSTRADCFSSPLTPANFQYCPKRRVSRLYSHFPRSSSPTAIFNSISVRAYVYTYTYTRGIGRRKSVKNWLRIVFR